MNVVGGQHFEKFCGGSKSIFRREFPGERWRKSLLGDDGMEGEKKNATDGHEREQDKETKPYRVGNTGTTDRPSVERIIQEANTGLQLRGKTRKDS